jgi:N-ethylmaleimide reductase
MTAESVLFTPFTLGPIALANRLVMAPLTRNRAGADNVPTAMMTTYYQQRSGAGLIISEGAQICPEGVGYPLTPGIHSPEQIAGWQRVTAAVHGAGGKIFLQLWHVGRISHPSLQPNGALPVAPSAVQPQGEAATYSGMQAFVTPRALDLAEIPEVVAQYRQAAIAAKEAGFDGVEIHGANGYLIDQFLRDRTNRRTDAYGGSFANRTRFLLEIVEAVIGVWGPGRVGVRLSPSGTFNDMGDSDPIALFSYVAEALNAFPLAYLHLVEVNEADLRYGGTEVPTAILRQKYQGVFMVCGEYNRPRAEAAIAHGADLVAFGRLFIANPDLPARLAQNAPLNEPDVSTFYGGDERGYVDYPFLSV